MSVGGVLFPRLPIIAGPQSELRSPSSICSRRGERAMRTQLWMGAVSGMSPADIFRKFPAAEPSRLQSVRDDGSAHLVSICEYELGGVQCRVHFYFYGDALAEVIVFIDDTLSRAEYRDISSKLIDYYKEDMGEPDSLIVEDEDNIGACWVKSGVRVKISCGYIDNEHIFALSYRDIDFPDQVSSAKPEAVDRQMIHGMVEDFWRAFLVTARTSPEASQRTLDTFQRQIEATAALMQPVQAAAYLSAIEEERESLFQEYRANPSALIKRLGVQNDNAAYQTRSQNYSGRHTKSLGDVAVRTAVRATVWEVVRAAFRVFR